MAPAEVALQPTGLYRKWRVTTLFKRHPTYDYIMGDSTLLDHPDECVLSNVPTPPIIMWKNMLEANIRVRATETGPL
jgi:hypothetical protein